MKVYLFLFALLLAGCARAVPEPIWIGHISPLSGSDRRRSEEAVGAMQMMLEEASEKERTIAGRPVGVRHADVADAAQARAEAIRLLTVNRVVALIIGPGVKAAEEVVSVARAHGAPVIVVDELPAPPVGVNVVLLGPDPVQRGRVLAEYAHKELKQSKAVLVVDRRDRIAAEAANAFAQEWRKRGGKIEEREKRGRDKVDLEVLASGGGDSLGTDAGESPREAVLLGGNVNGGPGRNSVYWAAIYSPLAKLPEAGADWKKRYEKRYQEPPSQASLLAHDALALVLSSLRKTNRADREALQKDLAGRESFDSLTGTLTWVDGRPQRTLYILRRQGGKDELVETVPAPQR